VAHTGCQLLERVTQLRRIRTAVVVFLVQGVDEPDLFVDCGRLRGTDLAADSSGRIDSTTGLSIPFSESSTRCSSPINDGAVRRVSRGGGRRSLRKAAAKEFLKPPSTAGFTPFPASDHGVRS